MKGRLQLKIDHMMEVVNRKVAASPVGHWFRLEGCGHPKERPGSKFTTEIRAGLATFFAMAYIISTNATILSDTGGTCVCNGTADDPTCDTDTQYLLCVNEVKQDLITATAAIASLSSFAMGLFANMPLGLAPGMGLNAYFAYQVVGYHGSGRISYSVALTAVFVEGWVFFALSLVGLRQWLARAIPRSIKLASGAGIGLYLTIIGLYGSAGLGVITGSTSTPVDLWGCDAQYTEEECPNHLMTSKTMWVGIFLGGICTALLLIYRVKGAIIIGIAMVSISSWPRVNEVTYFPYTEIGQARFDFFKKVVTFHPIQHILDVQTWDLSGISGQFGLAFITFLYVDILDTTGTLYSMARFCGAVDEETQDFEGSAVAYIVDALCIMIGSIFGCSPVTAFIESGAGISEGGATGLTGVIIGFCFFISVFFAPIFASIPPWATGSVLIIVGSMMVKSVTEVNWDYPGDAIPAFLTMAVMPFTYSIAYGLIAGVISYMLLNIIPWCLIKVSKGKLTPPGYENKDPWTYKLVGGVLPPWVKRLFSGKKRFWEEDYHTEGQSISQSASLENITTNYDDVSNINVVKTDKEKEYTSDDLASSDDHHSKAS